jgi:hypothetical protein
MKDVSGDRSDASASVDCSALASSPAAWANARRSGTPSCVATRHEETGDAVWSATPVSGLLPRLHLGDGQESSLTPARFVELLIDHLRTASPAWDPYNPEP